jgi:predicted transposase YbfD/YdcC
MDHTSRAVLAQTNVDAKTNAITRFQPLLDGLDLAGRVITADALHTQHAHADWLVNVKHAAYLLIVKASLRNLAIGILRARGHRTIAAGLRRNARHATRVLPLLGIASP